MMEAMMAQAQAKLFFLSLASLANPVISTCPSISATQILYAEQNKHRYAVDEEVCMSLLSRVGHLSIHTVEEKR